MRDEVLDNELYEYDDDAVFTITPKGIACLALEDAGICSWNDERINAFWKIFELMMEKHGYLKYEE